MNTPLFRLVAVSLLGLTVLCTAPMPAPAEASPRAAAPTAAAQSGRYGPYATMRRANEVANWFRSQGFSAVAFHNGDGYYVDVR
jgi:hypothetical protein